MDSPVKAPWVNIRLGCINESTIDFKLSDEYPPILQACCIQKQSEGFASQSTQENCFELECTTGLHGYHSAFLTFTMGDLGKKFVVWIWMQPEDSAAEIQVENFPHIESLRFYSPFLDGHCRS